MMNTCVVVFVCVATLVSSGQSPPSVGDLQRARTKVPRSGFQDSFVQLASALNPHIRASFPYATPCENWTVPELQALQRRILSFRSLELNDIYDASADPRSLDEGVTTRLWQAANAEVGGSSLAVADLQRSSHCRETVMWLVHHLSEAERSRSFKNYLVPLLGEHVAEESEARQQIGLCGDLTATPAVCAHARASSVCGTCHVGSKDTPPTAQPPADAGAAHQPLWPRPMPEAVTTKLRVYFQSGENYTLGDEVIKDYRYAHGQQLFTHSETGAFPGCNVLIENVSESANIWAWVQANGTTKCLKLWQGVTLLPQEFVRTSGGFARAGRKQVVEPTTGEVRDAWVWCRANGVCYYEGVDSHVPVQYDPTGAYSNASVNIVETYSNFTYSVDKGSVQLPVQCPDRAAPPLWSDNTLQELVQMCKPLYGNNDAAHFIV